MSHISFSWPSMVGYTCQWLYKYLLGEVDKQFQESVVQIVYISVETPLFYWF